MLKIPFGASLKAVQNCSIRLVLGLSMPSPLRGQPKGCSKLFHTILSNPLLGFSSLHPISKKPRYCEAIYLLAVEEGFEPSIRCRIHTFQACSFDHSDTQPNSTLYKHFPGVLVIRTLNLIRYKKRRSLPESFQSTSCMGI